MSDVVRCDGMLAMDETVIPYEGAGVLGYQVNNGERVSAGRAGSANCSPTKRAHRTGRSPKS